MKKMFMIVIMILLVFSQVEKTKAMESDSFEEIATVLAEINEKYNTIFHILSEKEYYTEGYYDMISVDYDEYLSKIKLEGSKGAKEICESITMLNETIETRIVSSKTRQVMLLRVWLLMREEIL